MAKQFTEMNVLDNQAEPHLSNFLKMAQAKTKK